MTINKFLVLPLALGMLVLGSIGSASAQTVAPRVAIQLATGGLTSPLTAGMNNAVLARLILDTTGSSEAVRISSLPFNLSLGGGAQASTLQTCQVFNESAPTVALSSNSTASSTLVSGLNSVQLMSPIILAANTVTTLALRCNIGSDLVSGSTYTFSMNTANVAATGVSTGLPAVVTVRGTTSPIPNVPNIPQTPNLPATGAGGEATRNILIVLGSIVVAGLGLSMTRRNPNKA